MVLNALWKVSDIMLMNELIQKSYSVGTGTNRSDKVRIDLSLAQKLNEC